MQKGGEGGGNGRGHYIDFEYILYTGKQKKQKKTDHSQVTVVQVGFMFLFQ